MSREELAAFSARANRLFKGETDRERGVGHGKHGSQPTDKPGPERCVEAMAQHPGGKGDGQQRGGCSCPQAQGQGVPELGVQHQCAPCLRLQRALQCRRQGMQQRPADQQDQDQRQNQLPGALAAGRAQALPQALSGASTARRNCPMSSISAGCTLCGIG